MPNSNNGTQSFGVEGNKMAQKKAPHTTLLTQNSNTNIKEHSQPPLTSQIGTGKPVYTILQYPQTQVKGPSSKQQAILKQTASLEKFDRGSTPQKLPNLKPVHSSMSQYNQMEEQAKVGEGLLPQKNQQSNSKHTLQFS